MGQTYSWLINSFWYLSENNIEDTIKNLSVQREHLTNKISEMEQKNESLKKSAMNEYKKGKKNKALSLMKIKKLYEQEIDKIENLLFCINTQELALTSSCTLKDSLSTIRHASSTMNAMNCNIDLSKIDSTLDIVNDTHDLNQEIQETLNSHTLSENCTRTDEDLLYELNEICNKSEQELVEEPIHIEQTPQDVNNNKPPTPPTAELELPVFERVQELHNLLPEIKFDYKPQIVTNQESGTPELMM